ncbi:hypothetical protein ABW636_01335 [Aquimarina sp. 2201CG1-2-11]|uniref:hypothetical protein n=1 Tax=Aquimarina discodermiae TaxID=3231043 RepID=UPI00346299FB
MKLNLVIYFTFLFVCSMSFGQDFQTDYSSVRSIDDQIQEEQYSTNQEDVVVNRLIVESSILTKDKDFYSKKEWRRIKRELRKNKKKAFSFKNNIHTSKTLDTIHVNIPLDKNTSISSW